MLPPVRIGYGTDTHRLKEGLPLIIGGVTIPHNKGVEAHSDGDLLLHAITDAILGALGKRDIGFHFPDTEKQWSKENSFTFLQEALQMMEKENYNISNLDCTIHAQKPKLSPFIPQMTAILSRYMKIEHTQINIKAKTGEKAGFIGREEGMHAQAAILLYK
ncbi:MAG: 2-C-methyl-D-erythritol 2,4-cyclodiphosphate synthase [Bacteroidales bacterium]